MPVSPRANLYTEFFSMPDRMSMLVATLLSGSWRRVPPPFEDSICGVKNVLPLLLKSGAGALLWWRIRGSEFSTTIDAVDLKQAYRIHTLEAERNERSIREALTLFRSAGVEPVLVKGWAIARQYPEQGLRPYGDLDLCVRHSELRMAQDVLRSPEGRVLAVDLHCGFDGLHDRGFEDLNARSELVPLGDIEVRVLSSEDHLRLLCIHLLRHGAFRPLWLCDVALASENSGSGFDWDRCLGGSHMRADWITCTVGLARELLGARLHNAPPAVSRKRVPQWLIKSVSDRWTLPLAQYHGENRHIAPMAKYLRRPKGVFRDLRTRWPDPISATMSVGGPFNALPRLPFQLANCVQRTVRFLKEVPRSLSASGNDLDCDTFAAVERH